ncbi:MAG: serine/threonine protein kinase, partial [Gammaproteobacteria bacterium]
MKGRFWTADWFAGLIVTLVLLFAAGGGLLDGLERGAYDIGVRSSTRTPSDQVAVIAIDDESIANLGRWPWSRDIFARMVDILREGGAKVVGNTIFFLEPQIDPGLEHIQAIGQFLGSSSLYREVPGEIELLGEMLEDIPADAGGESIRQLREFFSQSNLAQRSSSELADIARRLTAAAEQLNTDRILATSIADAGNVVLAMPFVLGQQLGNPDEGLPEYFTVYALPSVLDRVDAMVNGLLPLPAITALPPIASLAQPAQAIGHLNASVDVDGGIRSEPLVLRYYDSYFPSLSLQLAAKSLNLGPEDIQVNLGEGVRLGGLNITTDPALRMQTFFYGDQDGRPAFAVDSFFDVFTGKVPPEKYRNKIVLLGATATGVGSPQVTPVSPAMPPVVTLAHSVS